MNSRFGPKDEEEEAIFLIEEHHVDVSVDVNRALYGVFGRTPAKLRGRLRRAMALLGRHDGSKFIHVGLDALAPFTARKSLYWEK